MTNSRSIRRVFLSSTFVDLRAHRQAMHDIIERMGQFTIGMEQFGAQDGDAQSISLDQLAAADLYIGIIAWRYGYIPPGQEYSVTQQEYQEATRLGLPRYLFLADASTQTENSPDALYPASVRDPDHREQLQAFREHIKQERVVDFFTTPENLALKVAAALHDYLQAHLQSVGLAVPRDLPPRAPGYIGHAEDIQTVCDTLQTGKGIAIVGMGGLGKSSLAAEAVHALVADPETFPGGVTWVRCDERNGIAGLTWVEDQLLSAWGAPLSADALRGATSLEEGLALREQALRECLTTPNHVALVILDNVEPTLPLKPFLDTAVPLGITPLLTMRSEPATPQLQLTHLEGLPLNEAVTLFAERYQARGGVWDVAQDQASAERIVTALGFLPLAIELAAARAAHLQMSLAELAEELQWSEMLGQLSDPVEVSAGVRYSLNKTLRALPDAVQEQFVTLGLPEGPDWPVNFIVAMFSAMGSASPGLEGLDALIAYSLVSVRADAQRTRRIRLHPLVRELAQEQWRALPAERQQVATVGLLEGVHTWVSQHKNDFNLLEQDETSIACTLRTAGKLIEPRLVAQTIEDWYSYLFTRNLPLDEEMNLLRLANARMLGDRQEELRAIMALREAGAYLNRDTSQYSQEAMTLARDLGEHNVLLRLLENSMESELEAGNVNEAEQVYEVIREITAQSQGHLDARALGSVGYAASLLGKSKEAITYLEQAMATAREAHDVVEGRYNWELAGIYEKMGNTAKSLELRVYGLEWCRKYKDEKGMAVIYDWFGEHALKGGDLKTASEQFHLAWEIFESLSDEIMIPHIQGNLAALQGELARQQGNRTEALQKYQEALAIFASAPLPYGHGNTNYVAFVQGRIASLDEPTPDAEQLASAPITASPPRANRRLWPWGRRQN